MQKDTRLRFDRHMRNAIAAIFGLSCTLTACTQANCEKYDPAEADNIFTASGGLASGCFETRFQSKQKQFADEKASASKNQELAESLSAEAAEKQQAVAALKDEVDKTLRSVAALTKQLENLQATGESDRIEYQRIGRDIVALQKEIDRLSADDARNAENLSNYERQVGRLRKEYEALMQVYIAIGK